MSLVHPVFAASFKISPSSNTYTQGCNYAVDILMDTDNKSSNAGDILINYDPSKIEINEVKPGTTYGNYFGNIVDSSAGTIRLTGASFNTPFNGNGVFATILFKPKVNTGNSDFKIFYTGANSYNTLDSNIADTLTSTDLLSSVQNGFYAFTSGQCVDDRQPPNIQFTTPIDNQIGIPSDANIVIHVSDSGSGVDIGLVRITINGIVYTVKNSQVFLTGDTTNYGFTIKPASPLNSNSANTVLVNATDIAGNSTQQLITFNLPASPNLCIIPVATPVPSTPTYSPTNAPTNIPTNIPTIIPTYTPISTPPPSPIIDHQSPSLDFVKPVSKDTVSLTPEIIFKVDDPDTGINLQTIQLMINDQVISFDTPGFSSKGSKFTSSFTYQVKDTLVANTNYTITVFAADNSGNGISKSIIVRTTTPLTLRVANMLRSIPQYFPILLIALFVIFVIFYLFNILHKINHLQLTPLGQVINLSTLEPIPNFPVKIFDDQNKYLKTSRTNILGIFSSDLNPGIYQFIAQNTTSEPITISKDTDNFLNLSVQINKSPQDDRLFEPLNQFLVLLGLRLPPHGYAFNSAGHLQPNLTINLLDTKTKSIITSRITNQIGQYRFIVPHGRYLVEIPTSPQYNFIVDTRHLSSGYTTINRNLFL